MIRIARGVTVALIGLSGCVPQRQPLPPQPRWEVTQWPTGEHFHVEVDSVQPLGPKQVRITGRVLDFTIDLETVRARREWYYPVVRGRAAYRPEQRPVREVLNRERRQPSSRQVVLDNPVGPGVTITLGSGARFETTVTADERHFFQRPPRHSNPYLGVFRYTTQRVISLSPRWRDPRITQLSTQRLNRDHRGNTREIPVWFYDTREEAVAGYVQRSLPLVTFVVEDNDTRSPVRPDFRVVALEVPSRTQLEQQFGREFQDDGIAASALARAPQYDASGLVSVQAAARDVNQFSFRGVAGGIYKIETRHEDYYYFEGTITVGANSSVDKTLLLVKTPLNVRISEDRGPVRGRIVDRGGG